MYLFKARCCQLCAAHAYVTNSPVPLEALHAAREAWLRRHAGVLTYVVMLAQLAVPSSADPAVVELHVIHCARAHEPLTRHSCGKGVQPAGEIRERL